MCALGALSPMERLVPPVLRQRMPPRIAVEGLTKGDGGAVRDVVREGPEHQQREERTYSCEPYGDALFPTTGETKIL